MALLCCCLGLRISECLALKWSDVDWLNGKLLVERGIVCQNVDDVKTDESRKQMVIAGAIVTALQSWKQTTQFSAPEDWIFASPVQLGRLPWSYDQVWRVYQKGGEGGGHRRHRHSRSPAHVPHAGWTPWAHRSVCMQKLMRHSGRSHHDAIRRCLRRMIWQKLTARLCGLALNGAQAERKAS